MFVTFLPYSVTSSKRDSSLNANKPYWKTKNISLNMLVDNRLLMLTLLVFHESTYEKVNITINYFWMFSLITALSSMPVSNMPVKWYNWMHPIHILICITSLKYQLNIRTTTEFSEKYSEIWNQRHIHIECNQWICIENQLRGFYFKITLTGNELSITNHEVHGFSNSFENIRN